MPFSIPLPYGIVVAWQLANAILFENNQFTTMDAPSASRHSFQQEISMRIRNSMIAFGLLATLALAGCSTTSETAATATRVETSRIPIESSGKVTDAGYALPADRKSVVEGKRVSVRVDMGGG